MDTPLITISNLSRTYPKLEGRRKVDVLKDVNFEVREGEFLVLLGPSGSGKSTLLRILAGFDKASSGKVIFSPNFKPEETSFVFQNFGLLPWLTVFQNVEIGLIGKGIRPHERAREIDEILKELGLFNFKSSFPHELSGGMKQRVGLARAFVTKPKLIFLDEPFSELDFYTVRNLREVLLHMWEKSHTTVIMVSHYIDEAISMSDRIAILGDKPSSIKSIIENPLSRPRAPRSPEFFALEDDVIKQMGK